MRKLLLGVASAFALVPGVANAALVLNTESANVADNSVATPVTIEVFFTETAPAVNENAGAITFTLNLPGGFQFSPVAPSSLQQRPTVHPFVGAGAGPVNEDTGQRLNAAYNYIGGPESQTATFRGVTIEPDVPLNIADNQGLIKLTFLVPAGTLPGVYTLTPNASISDTAGNGVPLAVTPGTITVVPEPASLGLLALGGLFALRRRRTA